MAEKICFKLNEKYIEVAADESMRLIDLLRNELRLTGTKEGCGEGECGTCTVLLDGEAVNSCLILATQIKGRSITTIEGLEKDGQLHPIQRAFLDAGAVQCGYCTPGMILSAKALLDKNKNPAAEEVKRAISGNLCRCTGYKKIEKAVLTAAEYLREEEGR